MVSAPQGRFAQFWEGLSPRERNLIFGLVIVFFVMGTAVLFYLRSQQLRVIENDITDMKTALGELYTKGAVYQEKLKEKKDRENNISSETLFFSTHLEQASSTVEELAVMGENEQPAEPIGEGLQRRSVEFSLKMVSLDKLTTFLAAVENKPGHVILTERLAIRSPGSSEDQLNVDVEVATYERMKEGTEPEEGEDKP